MEVNETNTDLFLIYYFFTKSYFDWLFLAPLIISFLKIWFIFGLKNSCFYCHTSNKKFYTELKEKLCNPWSQNFCYYFFVGHPERQAFFFWKINACFVQKRNSSDNSKKGDADVTKPSEAHRHGSFLWLWFFSKDNSIKFRGKIINI